MKERKLDFQANENSTAAYISKARAKIANLKTAKWMFKLMKKKSAKP